jgi:hypothetical protein
MKSQFAIFGLEEMRAPDPNDEKSGEPYFFRKYPQHYASFEETHEVLQQIISNNAPFVHYNFNDYVILEVFSKVKK